MRPSKLIKLGDSDMTIGHILYQLLIRPLELCFEVVYSIAFEGFKNHGLSIIVMSLAMNFLLLPLYRRADAIQDAEREAEQRMAVWVKHIKKTFKGDERFMMLQTYYRQNDYKPFYVLKGFLPLLLEVPFFIAAYHFLSNYNALKQTPFLFISDLGAPDKLLSVAGVEINLLPILMTLINCVSGTIYTKGLSLKDKLQLYGMAAFFLVILYDSPAGLVLYWTLNNLFSLVKNFIIRLKNPKKALFDIFAALGLGALVYGVFIYETARLSNRLVFILIGVALMLPLAISFLPVKFRPRRPVSERTPNRTVFLCACVFLSVLTGVLIPSAVILSSPQEFVQMTGLYSPLRHVLNSALLSFGMFTVWFGIFYYMFGARARWRFGLCVWLFVGVATVDYMVFGMGTGTMTCMLQYESTPSFSLIKQLLNVSLLLGICALFALIYKKRPGFAKAGAAVIIAAALSMSAVNCVGIQNRMPEIESVVNAANKDRASFTLNKNGKNVVVIMLDRAISAYLPYIFAEKPELKQKYAGFTYYPNTISYGGFTNTGSPAIFGGYEYTPAEMNKRDDTLLEDKHNEALKVMPYTFLDAGYEVTVCDPPYAGYQWIPDLTVFDEKPEIQTYITEHGQFSPSGDILDRVWERNFFMYGLMKTAPVSVQNALYRRGNYFAPQTINYTFMNSFMVLCSFSDMTRIGESDANTFFMISNSATHEPALLQEPDYTLSENPDNSEYDRAHADRFELDGRVLHTDTEVQIKHYHINMASLLQLGYWLDCLRENGVYDNTRIIIVADHGRDVESFDDMIFRGENGSWDIMMYNPLLLVKDFGDTEFKTDYSFMTNADVPALAFEGLVTDPVNPFTGKAINSEPKYDGEQEISASGDWSVSINNGYTFLSAQWLGVSNQDIFDMDNWRELGEK